MSVFRTRIASIVAATAFLVLAAGPVVAARVTVAVVDRAFIGPDGGSTVTIDPGDTVVWRAQNIGMDHTVTGGERGSAPSTWLFEVTFSKSGDRFEWTYAEPGTYRFFCEFHGGMDGTVVVLGPVASIPPPTPATTTTPVPTASPAPSAASTAGPSASPTSSGSPGPSGSPAPSASPSGEPSAASPAVPTPPADASSSGEPKPPVTAESRILAVVGLVTAALVLTGLTSLYRRVNR
jgi:plastocyanin